MAVNIPGLVGVIIFYVIILLVGIYAARKKTTGKGSEEIYLANRGLGTVVSFFTMTGKWREL